MYYAVYKRDKEQYITIKLKKHDIEYLLKEKSIQDFDNYTKVRIELEGKI